MGEEIRVGKIIRINQKHYQFLEHPFAPGNPYGQEGRQATVYKLGNIDDPADQIALKAFKSSYRKPSLVSLSKNLKSFASFEGLAVCERIVLTPQNHLDLLKELPGDFVYSVAMPWIEGPTWFDIIQSRRVVSSSQSLNIASHLANVLSNLEQAGAAHCDISGPNLILPVLNGGDGVELIDVEGFYAPGFPRPAVLVGASPGYGQRKIEGDFWGSESDRFSGAILLAEILCWCSPQIQKDASFESYFEPEELQSDCLRLANFIAVLKQQWGDLICSLFLRAWNAETLQECPTFGEWVVALADVSIKCESEFEVVPDRPNEEKDPGVDRLVDRLIQMALRFERQGKLEEALQIYQEAQCIAKSGSDQSQLISLKLQDLAKKVSPTQGVSQDPGGSQTPIPEVHNTQPKVNNNQNKPQRISRWRLILKRSWWILGLGIGVGLAALLFSSQIITWLKNTLLDWRMISVLGDGFGQGIAGLAQIFVLRRSIRWKPLWVILSLLGGLIIGLYIDYWSKNGSILAGISIFSLGIGFLIGILQANLVGMRKFKTYLLWAMFTGIAWSIGWTVAYFATPNINGSFGIAVSAFLLIAITGLAIVPLLGWIKSIEF